VIERYVPGAGKLGAADLTAISRKSCEVSNGLSPQIEWVQSYVTGDKLYCLDVAPNEDLIRENARSGGFPANSISEVTAVIGPVKG
jgi:Nickel responsive protein SCO4226-like